MGVIVFHFLLLPITGFNPLQKVKRLCTSYDAAKLQLYQIPKTLDGEKNAVQMPTPYAVFGAYAIRNIQGDSCYDTKPALVYCYFLTASVSVKTWHRKNGKICSNDHRPCSRTLINHFRRQLHKSDNMLNLGTDTQPIFISCWKKNI